MKLCPTVLGLIAVFSGLGKAQVTWPNAIDELEDVMFLGSGYRSRGLAAHITPCGFSEFGPGRQTAAEMLRTGFHDMATTNVFFAPHGGIDGSLQFELNNGENVGAGFNTTLGIYGSLYNSRLSIADLVALGVYASVRTCGGPIIPMRGGRIDATAAGSLGVPQPQNGQGIFTNQFARMGFNSTDMIKMVACGHTLGGVHAGDFSNIVAPGTVANDFQLFDASLQFDNAIATRYINGPNTDPLSVGISVANTRNSDTAVFTADSNVTLKAMTDAATFNSMCQDILQRMIEVVDPSIVTLSPIIVPYEVKPEGLQLTLLSGGASISFTGDIRVRTTFRSVASVSITYLDRTGAAGGTISTSVSGTATGFDDSFSFWEINANIPASTSISSFTVIVTDSSGNVETFNNNGAGFLISDSVIVQTPQSCLSNGNLTVLAAIRATVTTPVNLNATWKVARTAGNPIVSPVPSLVSSSLILTKGAAIGPYNIYSGSVTIGSTSGAKFGVASGTFADDFKDPSALGTACAALGTTVPSSTSSSVISTKTSSSTSASATPTLTHVKTVGPYSFLGCYTEGTGVRALAGASFYNYTSMTIEQCASSCVGSSYFGVEYGGECYCGNALAASSTLAPLSDCSFICPGNPYEYCGAGNRLEMYELTALISSSSSLVISTSSTKSSSSSVAVSTTTSKSGSSSLLPTSTSKISSSSVTATSSSATASQTLGIKERVLGYNFQGCYTEATTGRALSSASYFDYTAMTLESCATNCAGYTLFGVEYGGECYCGNVIGTGSVLAAASDCSFVCPGNPYEYCGAGNRLEMYKLGAASTSSSLSSTSSLVPRSTSSIVSTSSVKTTSSSKVSTPSVTSSSSVKSSSSTKVSTSSSKSSTASSKSSTLSTSTIPTSKFSTLSSSISATPTQTAPAIKPTVGSYIYYGCQTEATNVRALSGGVSYNYTAMTLEMCATSATGFKYFGVEYGGECYFGNTWNTGSVNATASDCSFLCPGNGLEYCGAGNRLSAYYLP